MKQPVSKETLRKLDTGDPLSDQECYDLWHFLKPMEDSLMIMGERYHFAWWGIMMNRRTVEGYIEARRLPVPKL